MGKPGKNNIKGYYRSITTCDRCAKRQVKCDAYGIDAPDCSRCVKDGADCEWSLRSKQPPRGRQDGSTKKADLAVVEQLQEEIPAAESKGRRSRHRQARDKAVVPDSAVHEKSQRPTRARTPEDDPGSSDLSDAPPGDDKPLTPARRARVRSESSNVQAQGQGDRPRERKTSDERGPREANGLPAPGREDRLERKKTSDGSSEGKKLSDKPSLVEKLGNTPIAPSPIAERPALPQPAAEDAMTASTSSRGKKRKPKVVSSDEEDDAPAQPKAGPSRLRDAASAQNIILKVDRAAKKGDAAGFFESSPAPAGPAGLKVKINLKAEGGPKAQRVATASEDGSAEGSASKRPKLDRNASSTSLSTSRPERKKKRRETENEVDDVAQKAPEPATGEEAPKRSSRLESKRKMRRHDFTDSEEEEEEEEPKPKPRRKRIKSEDAEYQGEPQSDGDEEASQEKAARKANGKLKGKAVGETESAPSDAAQGAHKLLKNVKREDGNSSGMSNAGTPDATKEKSMLSNGSKTGTPASGVKKAPAPPANLPKKPAPQRDLFADTLMRMSGVASGASTAAKKEEKPETNGKTGPGPRFRVAEKEERNRKRNELYASAPVLNLMGPSHLISSYEGETRNGSALVAIGRRDESYNNVKSGCSIAILQGLLALKDREGLLKPQPNGS